MAPECPGCHKLIFKRPHDCEAANKYKRTVPEPEGKTKPKSIWGVGGRYIRPTFTPIQAGYLMAVLYKEKDKDPIAKVCLI